jgi:hypothetical protein
MHIETYFDLWQDICGNLYIARNSICSWTISCSYNKHRRYEDIYFWHIVL